MYNDNDVNLVQNCVDSELTLKGTLLARSSKSVERILRYLQHLWWWQAAIATLRTWQTIQ